MSGGLVRLSAAAIDAVRVNAVRFAEREGRAVVIKRRKPLRSLVFPPGNLFLRLSKSRIRMFTSTDEWIAHALDSFALLHGPHRTCGRIDGRTLFVEHLPGESLRARVGADRATVDDMRACGRELRRAHGLYSARIDGPWSHGDPHLDNVLVDGGRARLIDFETIHEAGLGPDPRHADDLLVLLLDLMGCTADWPALARPLVATYGRPAVVAALVDRLDLPAGFEAILWSTRTHAMPRAALGDALTALRRLISELT